jgi:hypothetical protein
MTAVWTKPLFYFQTLHFSDSCMTAVWKFLCSTFRHSTFLTAVWQLCENSFVLLSDTPLFWQLYDSCVKKSLVLLLDTPLFWQLYDSCVKNVLLHQSDLSDLAFPSKIVQKIPFQIWNTKSIYKTPHFRPNWSGHSSTPLFSYHHSTLLYPLARDWRSTAVQKDSQPLSFPYTIGYGSCLSF